MGELLRCPGTTLHSIAERLEVGDIHTVRVTLGRLADKGLVRPIADGWVLGRAGIEHLASVRQMVSG